MLAVSVMEYALPAPAAGVPDNVAVPFPLSLKVTPLGSAPVSVSDGVGVPVVVTVNVPAVPTANVVLLALVITGAAFAAFTVSVKAWVVDVPTPLLAANVREYVPTVPEAGVPPSVPVPLWLSTNATPLGSVPVSVKDGAGKPVVDTVNDPAEPAVNVALLALVITGA